MTGQHGLLNEAETGGLARNVAAALDKGKSRIKARGTRDQRPF
jgi:hypothetical protein